MSRSWAPNTTDRLSIPGGTTVFNFNTNVCIMAIINPVSLATADMQVVIVGVPGRGVSLQVENTTGKLIYTKLGVVNIPASGTMVVTASEWNAIMGVMSTGGAASFKRYRYSTLNLLTETVADAGALNSPTTPDGGTIGNLTTPNTAFAYAGAIDRVLVGQGVPSDAEFTAWARAGTIPPSMTVRGYWILSPAGTAVSPETDSSGNGNNLTVTGTTASAAFVLPDAVPDLGWMPLRPPSARRSYRVVNF